MMEETVSKPARILEVAIKASILGIILVPIITIVQLTSGEILDVFAFLIIYLLIFVCTGATAMGFYRAEYGRDALAILAAGTMAGGVIGILSGISNAFLSLQFQPLYDDAGATIIIYMLCMCPLLFIGALSSGPSAWVMSFLPLSIIGIDDELQATEEKKAAIVEVQQTSEIEQEVEQKDEADAPILEDNQADDSNPTMKLRQAIRLIETDRKEEAQRMLIALTRKQNPPDPLVWLWLASTLDNAPEKKRQCIQKVLDVHPTSPIALDMLNNLEKPIQPPIPPPPAKKVPISHKPEMSKQADEPQKLSTLPLMSNQFWRRFRMRMIWAAITIILIFVCNGLNSLLQ